MYYLYVGDPLPFPEGWRGPSVEERVKGWCWIVDQMKKDVWWTDEVAVSESQMVVKSWFSWPTSTHESLLPKAAALWHTCLSTSLIVRQTKSVSTHTQNTAKSLTLCIKNLEFEREYQLRPLERIGKSVSVLLFYYVITVDYIFRPFRPSSA